jgi:hypothetical protein
MVEVLARERGLDEHVVAVERLTGKYGRYRVRP